MKKVLLFSLLSLIFIQMNSCELIDEPEQIPAYIQIDTMNLSVRNSSEGTTSHNIKDAWLFVNSQLIGAFELPMKAPVLEEGEQVIEIFAGIDDNGIAAIPEVYPFYEYTPTTVNFEAGKTVVIEPTMRYSENTTFAFIEGFEIGNRFTTELDGNNFTEVEVITAGRYEGQRSGQIRLTAENPLIEVGTASTYQIYDNANISSPIYMELNYKNNIPFEIGVIGYEDNVEIEKVYITGLNPSEDWNKVYVNLSVDVSAMNAKDYRIILRAVKLDDVEVGEIFLDNIKLLHF